MLKQYIQRKLALFKAYRVKITDEQIERLQTMKNEIEIDAYIREIIWEEK